MIQWPTFTDFRDRLIKEAGCKYLQLPASVAINEGDPNPVFYFERDFEGEVRRYVVAIPDGERLAPSTIRSICNRLGVDPAMFGLELG